MFLYAKLIFDTVWDLELEDIHEELTVPPEDLEDAYGLFATRSFVLR